MATGMLHSHYLFVVLFTLIYLIKTILLLSDRTELLDKFKMKTKVAEMIISFGFLATGIYLLTQLPVVTMYHIIKISLVFVSIPLAIIGYKKQNKVLASLSFFLIVVSFGLAHKAKDAKAGDKSIAINGNEIYQEKCALCHGNEGKLGMSGAKDITVTNLSHSDIVSLIANGKNTMPAFNSTLNSEQIEAVTNYIETELKAK
jgi:mono/diheme cytochrome c family protein